VVKAKAGAKRKTVARRKTVNKAPAFSEQEIRRVLLEHRYLMTADELCAKWAISRATLREWKKVGRFDYLSGDLRELVIAALASAGSATLERPAGWADYQDHSPYSEAEIRVVVDGLVAEGIAAWDGENGVRYAPSESRLAGRFVF
jgi:hypothetical protein